MPDNVVSYFCPYMVILLLSALFYKMPNLTKAGQKHTLHTESGALPDEHTLLPAESAQKNMLQKPAKQARIPVLFKHTKFHFDDSTYSPASSSRSNSTMHDIYCRGTNIQNSPSASCPFSERSNKRFWSGTAVGRGKLCCVKLSLVSKYIHDS